MKSLLPIAYCLFDIAYLQLNTRYIKSKHMSAFVIVEVTIRDHKEYEEYKKLTPASIEAYGGRFIIRGAKTETLEGEWNPERMVVLEFATVARAKEWWNSPEYSKAKAIRQRTASTNMIVVEGYQLH
jgi:uncharacterized protein (DUF1330 family)